MKQYSDSLKANFSNDYELALKVITNKGKGHEEADKLLNELPVDSFPAIEKIKNVNNFAGNIVKVYLKLKLE